MARQASQGGSRELSPKTVGIWLGIFIILALVLRIAFNVGVSHDEEAGRYLYSGNDPYYHDRTVDHIVSTGESLIFDPAINYPNGAYNPNPPIYDWDTAFLAGILDTAGVEGAVSLALNLSVAMWGALTIIPVYLIAADLFGRRGGLWAGFFMAFSAPHIQRSIFGFADHDATTMFFIALAFAFLIKALRAIKSKTYVRDWQDAAGRADGIKAAFAENNVAMLWSALAGTALAATALTWKGYPYALGVMALALGVHLLLDHQRHKDSVPVFGVYLIPLLMVLILPLPWYLTVGFVSNTIMATIYVLLGMLVVGAMLIPTREMPSVLVFPALILTAIVGFVLAMWVFPGIGATIFTGLGYFQQSKLYSTIAEAQRTELGFVVANMGFFTFFLGLWGLGRSIRRGWKGDGAWLLMASWGILAVFMALAASRFVFNAAPVFAILSGGMAAHLVARLGFDEVRARFRRLYGQGNAALNSLQSLTWKASLGVLAVVLLLVMPNAWLGVDAAVPRAVEAENDFFNEKRWGAFGLSFDIQDNGWLEAFQYLATLDQDVPLEERPAFLAWWDYGHWATNVGLHPTVADPFQHHYNIAGRFLASESEEEAMSWLVILLINGDYFAKPEARNSDAVQATLRSYDEGLLEIGPEKRSDREYTILQRYVTGDQVFELFDQLSEDTDRHIKYLGVDRRMFPIQDQPGIFYAPAYLANKNPDEFIGYQFSTGTQGGLTLTMEQYGIDKDGNSYRHDQPKFRDSTGKEWEVLGNQAFPKGQTLTGTGIPVQPRLNVQDRFADTMYARSFGGIFPSAPAGESLEHWRAIHQSLLGTAESGIRQVALLEYYKGYRVEGTVYDGLGTPQAGMEVTFIDGFGSSHATNVTADDGSFSVLAPFSVGNDLTLAVRVAGQVLHSMPFEVTREQADGGSVAGVRVDLPLANLEGMAFRDMDADRAFNASKDQALAGVEVKVGDRVVTTGADGRYSISDHPAGVYELSTFLPGYQNLTMSVTLTGANVTTQDLVITPIPSTVTLQFTDAGAPVPGVPMSLEGPTTVRPSATDSGGNLTVQLMPGEYTATVDHTFEDTDGNEVVYAATKTFMVAFGGEPFVVAVENGSS